MDKTLKNAVLVITLSLLLAALLPVLADQTRLLPGGYGSAAYAEEKPERVIYGTYFDAWVGSELVESDDPAGTEYRWEVEGGSVGSVEGGTITDQSMENNDFRFYAAKTGLVTVRFEAVYEGEILRTVTKKFNVVEPCETYYWVCSSMEAQDGGFSGGNDTSFDEIIKYNYISPGTTFTIDIHTWWEDERSYPTETTPKPTKDDFTFEQSGQGSVEEIESPGSSEAISFRFKCVNVGDMVLTLKAKDGSWSEDISFRVHADYMELPGILIRKSLVKDLKTSYSGGTIPFELTEEGDTPYKVKGMKRGKRFLLDKIVYAVSSDESIAVPGTCYWDVPIEYEGYDEVECSLPIRIIKAGTVKITIKDAKYNEALKSFEVNITDANVESYNKRWKNYASKTGLQYGETALVAWSGEGDKITINCAGVEQTKTVSAMEHVTFSDLPVMKTGTTGTVTYERFGDGLTVTKKFTVKDTKCYIVVSKVKTSSTKMTVKAKYAKAGDVIKIKAGGKTYTKKVTADNAYFKFTQKIKKQKKGAKIKVTVYNKFKQVRKTRTVKVTE